VREVVNDGRRAAVRKPAARSHPHPRATAARAARATAAQGATHSSKSSLQSLRSMSAHQAQRDLNAYWGQQARKYKPADVRAQKPARRLPKPMAVHRASSPSHAQQFHFAKGHSFDDQRAQGAAPWEYSWRRPRGASAQPLEKYDTQVQTGLRAGKTQGLRQTGASHSRAKAHDLPPMPGSVGDLLKQLHD